MGACCQSQSNLNQQTAKSLVANHGGFDKTTLIDITIEEKFRVEYLNAEGLAYEIGFQASPMTPQTCYWDGIRRVSMNILNKMIYPSNKDNNNNNSNNEWENKNVFISPFSISCAFALVFAGIKKDSESYKQISSVLNYPTMIENMDIPMNVSKMIIEEQLSLIKKLNPPGK